MLMSKTRLGPPIILLAVLAVFVSGCSLFNPPGGGDPPPPSADYRERTTPENVLHNLVLSYQRMEAPHYLDCLADTFTFWLNEEDVINDPTLPWYWDKDTEETIASNMFGDETDILSIQLTLTQYGEAVELPGPTPSDPSSWLYTETVDLWVDLPDNWRLHANAPSRYTFSVDPNETGPNGETLWEIAKWEDIDAPSRPTDPGEDYETISVSEFKALYREE